MRQATQQDVADRAGVSRPLVSLVMRGSPKVSPEKRQAVLTAAAELNYQPNAAAAHLAGRRTRTIGYVVEDLRNPFFADVAEGMEVAARENGYRLLLNSGHRRSDLESAAIDAFLQLRAEGLVLSSESIGTARITALGALVPTVVVGRPTTSRTVDNVHADDRLGARLAVAHLVELGHRRIAHITVANVSSSAAARVAGYREAMKAAGLSHRIQVERARQDDPPDDAGRVVDVLLAQPEPPSAVFASNDLLALVAMDRLAQRGVVVPQQVSVIGYDNARLGAMRQLGLTSIDQPRALMGQVALRQLLERIDGRTKARVTVLSPTLVVRTSTSGLSA